MAALSSSQEPVEKMRAIYKERREVLCGGLAARRASTCWCRRRRSTCSWSCPKGVTSAEFVSRLLDAGVVATPATGFGACGEGYVRLTLCADKARLAEAAERVQRARV